MYMATVQNFTLWQWVGLTVSQSRNSDTGERYLSPVSEFCVFFVCSLSAAVASVLVHRKEASRGLNDRNVSEQPKIEDICLELVPQMQILMGILGWASKTQPHLSYMFGELSRWSTKPTKQKLLTAKRALLYARDKSQPLKFRSIVKPKLRIWSDASYKLNSYQGRAG
eukprot:GHVR01045363.1.p1 GENE.GHVR01045363.1~~GHVR01045363.1.p1  ORF type:complete len:168 (+),score=13.92 GHVR01045363.1:394-897(+)